MYVSLSPSLVAPGLIFETFSRDRIVLVVQTHSASVATLHPHPLTYGEKHNPLRSISIPSLRRSLTFGSGQLAN
jgi:hypothetical protein